MNYGALGYIVGHEIIHGFDDRGRQFDENGNFKNWWSDETDDKFRKMSDCLKIQYNDYYVHEVNMRLAFFDHFEIEFKKFDLSRTTV